MKTVLSTLVLPVFLGVLALPSAAQYDVQEVFASDASPQATFSNKVAVSAGWAMVADAGRSGGAGAVYVFELTPSGWVERQILDNPHPNLQDYFGSSIALDGDTAVISCPRDDVACPSDPLCESGSAYVYEQAGGSWTLAARLVPGDNVQGDFFGYPLDLSGDTMMLGAQYDDESFSNSGSVYVYERTAAGWMEVQKLNASDPGDGYRFGRSIDLHGSQAVIAAPYNSTLGTNAGAVYVFDRSASGWSETAKLTSHGTSFLGVKGVAIDGDTVLLSGPQGGPQQLGFVRHFERDSAGWTERAAIEPRGPRSADDFGFPILLVGDRAIIGAQRDDAAGDGAGAVYVFDQGSSGEWSEVAKVLPPGLAAGDLFAISLAESQGSLLVGALADDGQATDAGSGTFIEVGGIQKYCPGSPNQSGAPAELSVRGTAGVQANVLTLVAGPIPPTAALFFYGAHPAQVPFGTLMRCVGGRTYRIPASPAGPGQVESTLDLTSPPRPSGTIHPGSTWYFQTWFRDPLNGTPHGFSDALAITFGP